MEKGGARHDENVGPTQGILLSFRPSVTTARQPFLLCDVLLYLARLYMVKDCSNGARVYG